MRFEDFSSSNSPGQLERTIEGYWTFLPAPLPPTLSFPAELVSCIVRAERLLGALAGVGQLLPNAHLLIHPFVQREAVLSSQIEGTITRLSELMLFETEPGQIEQTDDAREVQNYVRAMDHGVALIRSGMPLCLRLLREVHRVLMDGVRGGDKRPGEFRRVPVLIGRPGQTFDEARFVPAHPLALDPLLNELEKFLNDPGDLPTVVQLALAHYQFEAIHPFADGNGRIGRLLISLMLCERQVLPQPLLYLSGYLERRSAEYRDHLLHVSQRGTWLDWIRFFANGVAEQSGDAALRARQLLDLQQRYRERLQRSSQSSKALKLIDLLFSTPFVTAADVARRLEITASSATSNIERLIKLEILRPSDPARRWNRVFFAPEILGLLDAESAVPPES